MRLCQVEKAFDHPDYIFEQKCERSVRRVSPSLLPLDRRTERPHLSVKGQIQLLQLHDGSDP
jgi:hypothetical protein